VPNPNGLEDAVVVVVPKLNPGAVVLAPNPKLKPPLPAGAKTEMKKW
jgi:hypothetical protein